MPKYRSTPDPPHSNTTTGLIDAGLSSVPHQAGDSHDFISSLTHPHTSSNKEKHTTFTCLVAGLWTSKVDEHFSTTLLKVCWQFPIEMS